MRLKKRTMRKDQRGGIEGLPLQLMIMVVVAGVGMAIILGWMSGLQPPASIGSVHANPAEIVMTDEDGDGIFEKDGLDIVVTVVDSEGKGIAGVTVILEGSGISYDGSQGKVYGTTDSNGVVSFEDLSAKRTVGTLGFVTVTATKSGYGTHTGLEIPVICA